jgi:hypothetical protein
MVGKNDTKIKKCVLHFGFWCVHHGMIIKKNLCQMYGMKGKTLIMFV